MGSLVAIYWFVVFFFTSSVHGFAANETANTTSTTWTSHRPTVEIKDCFISAADLISNNIGSVLCGICGSPCAVADNGEEIGFQINHGDQFSYYCMEGYYMTGQRVASCQAGNYGPIPQCFTESEYSLAVICLSSALGGMVIIWMITLRMCRRKLRSQSRACHCKHSENDSFPLPYSLPSTAPQVPKRNSLPLPPHSPAMRTVSGALTGTPPTIASPNVHQEPNGKQVDMMYEYVEPRVNDYYLEITS